MLLVWFLAACGPAPALPATTTAPTETQVPPTSAPRPAATSTPYPTSTPSGPFPTGIYKAAHPLGMYQIEFAEDGTFKTLVLDGSTITGTYVVTGDRIVFNEVYGVCVGFPGNFGWSFDGQVLIFKSGPADQCPIARAADLQRPWEKQP